MKKESTTQVPDRHVTTTARSRPMAQNQSVQSIAALPRFVSQHTAVAVLGFKTERAFLEWLAGSGCRVVERGKDRLVLLDEAEEALLRGVAKSQPAAAERDEHAALTTAQVLARIGRRVGGVR